MIKMQTKLIPPHDIRKYWHAVKAYIHSFLDSAKGRFDEGNVLNYIEEGRFHCWVHYDNGIVKAVALTQFCQFPKMKELQIIMCSGTNYSTWHNEIQVIQNFAKDMGCKAISALARPGWEKALVQNGYKKTHVFFEKDIEI